MDLQKKRLFQFLHKLTLALRQKKKVHHLLIIRKERLTSLLSL